MKATTRKGCFGGILVFVLFFAGCYTPPAVKTASLENLKTASALRANVELTSIVMENQTKALVVSVSASTASLTAAEILCISSSVPAAGTQWSTITVTDPVVSRKWIRATSLKTALAHGANNLDDEIGELGWIWVAAQDVPTSDPVSLWNAAARAKELLANEKALEALETLAKVDKKCDRIQRSLEDAQSVVKVMIADLKKQAERVDFYATKLAAYSNASADFEKTVSGIYADESTQSMLTRAIDKNIDSEDRRKAVLNLLNGLFGKKS